MDILEDEFNAEGKAKGDIVLLTDDDYRLTDSAWMERYLARKQRLAFRVFGVAIAATAPGSAIVALSDNVRTVREFADPESIIDILQVV